MTEEEISSKGLEVFLLDFAICFSRIYLPTIKLCLKEPTLIPIVENIERGGESIFLSIVYKPIKIFLI